VVRIARGPRQAHLPGRVGGQHRCRGPARRADPAIVAQSLHLPAGGAEGMERAGYGRGRAEGRRPPRGSGLGQGRRGAPHREGRPTQGRSLDPSQAPEGTGGGCVKYLDLFREKFGDTPTGCAYEAYETPGSAPRKIWGYLPGSAYETYETPCDHPWSPRRP